MNLRPYNPGHPIRRIMAVAVPALCLVCSSCVHEFPDPGALTEVRLCLVHDLSWSEYDFVYNRSGSTRGEDGEWSARYIIRAYRSGDVKTPLYEFTVISDNLSLPPLYTSLALPAGEWDLYVWQDLTAGGRSYYDTADFSAISYTAPYTGDTDRRDAFEGRCRVTVDPSYEAGRHIDATIPLERPMAKYEFIATDFGKFYDEVLLPSRQDAASPTRAWASLSLQDKRQMLEGYSVTAYYPMFMPSVYDIFQQKAVDSARGIRYDAAIEPISDTEAVIAFDYVFMNHRESNVQVALVMRTPQGAEISITPTLAVPLRRQRITYVRGDFLTTGVGGGLDIDFSFTDDYNIEIR